MVGQKPKAKLTVEDYLKTSEGERYELTDGELIPVASPGKSHQRTLKRIGFPLNVFVDERNLGEVIFGPRDVVLTDTYVFVPDLLFISNERARIDTYTVVQGAPDLVVEIRSPSTEHIDWTTKRELYAQHGVKEYWLVHPDDGIVWVLLLSDGVFTISGVYAAGDTLTSPTLEGFTLDLEKVFQA
jgi:Uma2 family endonuclease